MESDSKSPNQFGYSGDVRIVAQLCCVVYDEEDGTVVHGHGALCLEGGEVPDEGAFQVRALELAQRSQELGSRRLRTMMVELAEVSGGPMRVDLTTGKLIVDDSQKPPVPYQRPERA